jgi:septal ring factor EnvC (AmiA/AmiB activator)
MANTFGILTALVLAFSAFVAYKNKEEYQTQKIATENEEAMRDRNTKTFDNLRAEIAQLDEDKMTANKSRDEVQVNLDAQVKKIDALKEEEKTNQAKFESVSASLKAKKDELVEMGPAKELAPKIERLTASIDELKDKVAILEAQNSKLRGEKSDTSTASTEASDELSRITSGKSDPEMRTSVRSVSSSLGFVTLSGGMNSGVVGGSKVSVMRDGEKVADMNVTAVSANTATADVIQSTLKEGDSVFPGDTVVPAEETDKK